MPDEVVAAPETPAEEVDYSTLSDDELDEVYNQTISEETPGEEKTPETPQSEEPVVEPAAETEPKPEPEPKLFAGKYKTVEELEKGYLNTSSESSKMAEERSQLKRDLDEYKAKIEAVVAPPTEVKPEGPTAPFSVEEYNKIYYEKGPADAQLYVIEKTTQVTAEQTRADQIKNLTSESETFNEDLVFNRARELMLDAAKEQNNEAMVAQLSDKTKELSEQHMELFPDVIEQVRAEKVWVDQHFGNLPMKIGDDVVGLGAKIPEDAYGMAHIILNHDKIVERTAIQANEDTAHAIQEATPGAKIISAQDNSKANIVPVKFVATDDEDQVYDKAKQMSAEDLDETLVREGLL